MTERKTVSLETLIAFAKRRGFVFPGSEIYGGLGAVYDYGPYGAQLAQNIRQTWWREMVQLNDNIVGLDSAVFMSPKVWVASGHVSGFSDPLSECKKCHARVRADHLLEEIGVFADEKMTVEEINNLFTQNADKISCPKCGAKEFTAVKKFNLLVKSNLGNFVNDMDKEPTYLRAETCQGIYVNFKNVVDVARVKIPFGVAQIGKAFRNEITARQFIFRKREFEQMEMQMFVHPEREMEEFEKWRQKRWEYYTKTLGFDEKNLRWHKHENLVFYARAAWDIEYDFPFGFKELEGIHARGDYDLKQHIKASGADLTWREAQTGEKFVPHVVETSVGVDRTFLAVLTEAYTEEDLGEGKKRIVLKLNKKLSPVKVAIFPLLRNKPELVRRAREIFDTLKVSQMCEFDDNGNVGKRYRRQDEIGTPYCVTVDFETLENDTVTVRDRDTMKQQRMPIGDLTDFFAQNI